MIESHRIRHVEHLSAVPYPDLITAFEAAIGGAGNTEVADFDVGAHKSTSRAQKPATQDGLVTLLKFDQERWLSLYGKDVRSRMYLYDDPSVTLGLLTDDLRVGAHVPFRLQIYQGVDGRARIGYDLPSSHIARLGNNALTDTALRIDNHVAGLIERITGGAPRESVYTVEYREHISDRPYSQLVEEFELSVGPVDKLSFHNALWTSATSADWERYCRSALGASGFLRLLSEDYGRQRRELGRSGAGKTYIYGNPILARPLIQRDVRIGENIPARLTIFQPASGAARIGYDLPASLLSRIGVTNLDATATKTADGLVTFIEMLTGTTA